MVRLSTLAPCLFAIVLLGMHLGMRVLFSKPRGARSRLRGLTIANNAPKPLATTHAVSDEYVTLPQLQKQQIDEPILNHEFESPPPPPPAASESAGACCHLQSPPPLNITLKKPVPMSRPIRVIFHTGNFDGPWPCDVPCEYSTGDHGGDADVVIGEGGVPSISSTLKRISPHILTGARSMESAINYPTLKHLGEQVDCPMTTSLATSAVPVVYLTRSSIAKWGSAPVAWNASALSERFGSGRLRPPAAVFVARNCHSKNGREDHIRGLDKVLRGGVDRPGLCLNSKKWPKCGSAKCGKHAVLRSYPFYLAFENSDEHDYVSEKVFHALEAGVLPIYNGAPNVDDFVPPHSVVDLKKFGGSLEKLAKHLHELLDDPERYLEYFAWKQRPLPEAFQRKFGFVATHAKCRLCRWAYAKKYNLPWSKERQRPMPTSGGVAL